MPPQVFKSNLMPDLSDESTIKQRELLEKVDFGNFDKASELRVGKVKNKAEDM